MNKKNETDRAALLEAVAELETARQEILDAIQKATDIVDGLPSEFSGIAARASAYWIPHIKIESGDGSEYLGGTMHSLADTIEELQNELN